jgi:hypothetical protein
MKNAYAPWLGQQVILQVSSDDLQVPLRGTVVGESYDAVRFRIGEGWDVDIFKSMILSIEEDSLLAISA